MFYETIIIIICISKPIQPSFLSRLKNRYEYIPLEENERTTEELLYDFPLTGSEKLTESSQPIPRSTRNDLKDDIYYILPQEDAIITTFETTSQLENISYDFDVWPQSLPQWRPTLMSTKETVTWKRRKTFPSHFPTKNVPITKETILRNVTDVTAASKNLITRRNKSKSLMLPWLKVYKKPIKVQSFSFYRNTTQPTRKKKKIKTKTEHLKRFFDQDFNRFSERDTERSKTSYCYLCGLDQGQIPRTATCYAVFESPDGRYRRLKKRYEVQCIAGDSRWVGKKIYSPWFRGGCFKRYLDVGLIYNERGCRTSKGWYGQSYASQRLVKLEKMLDNVEDGCVFSPEASLTPFSRAISLYARYHVCVCSQKYCNANNFRRLHSFTVSICMLVLSLNL